MILSRGGGRLIGTRSAQCILRKAFDTSDDPSARTCPNTSSGAKRNNLVMVLDALKETRISDEQFKVHKPERSGERIPETKEAYWYRLMFDNIFKPHCAETVKRWVPSWGAPSDPYISLSACNSLVDPDVRKKSTVLIDVDGTVL